jgi:hypothetical protein
MVWNSIPPRCPFDNKKCNESWSPKPKVNKDSFMLSCRYGSWDHTTVKPHVKGWEKNQYITQFQKRAQE